MALSKTQGVFSVKVSVKTDGAIEVQNKELEQNLHLLFQGGKWTYTFVFAW